MHTDEIYKLATSSGKLPILAEAFDHVLHTATLYDVPLTARYLKSDLLSYDRLHLAEHHLYGSSRLGIQRYLPSEYSYTASSTEGSTYDRLPESRSWYSRYANDLFSSGLSSNTLTSYNLSLSDLPLFNHILGNRQFELTNHLGNVQSTVLDRTHPRIGFAGNGSVITGYQANIASAQDYFPFGMYMPGRYISDTVQHCITVTKRIRVPRFMPWRFFPVTSYPPVFGTLSTHVFRYGDPVVPGVHELSKATLMAEEKPYVYHLLPASQHIGGAVLKAAAGPDSTAEYTIDLGGEPAPVYSYLHLHPDTALAIQSLNVTVHHSPGVLVEARIRQYNASGVEDFSVPLDWQPLPEGQPYALDFATDVTAIVAGGATMLEYRTSPVGGGTFAAASEVTYTSTIVTVSLSELRDVLVTICDEKDNYRFGFNGHEKDNEVVGVGNHLSFGDYGYDTRIGRRWNVEPYIKKYPSNSSYLAFGNNPIVNSDPDGNDKVYFNTNGTEAYREKSNIEFKTYIMANVKAGNPKVSVANWKEVPMPRIISERVASGEATTGKEYQSNDYIIAARVGYFNQAKNSGQLKLYTEGGNAIPQDAVTAIPDLDPTLIKSMAMQESHLGVTGETDIMQSNVTGDWSTLKAKYSLTKGEKPSVSNSLYSGIRILSTKGFKGGITYDKNTGLSSYKFQGWDKATENYNGGGVKNYQTDVSKMQNDATLPECRDYTDDCK